MNLKRQIPLALMVSVVLLSMAMASKGADSIDGSAEVSGGGTVVFTGASTTNWVYNADTDSYDFILTFANAASAGSFTLPGTTKARILAVGGGGGGGGAYRLAAANQPYGGGGGGGAGGLVETNALFGAGSYSVSVGAGGAGGAMGTSHNASSNYSGTDGEDTSILLDGASFITAYGGGAGGGEADGHAGGSGGGGSMYRVGSSSGTSHNGGACTNGQGRAGGAGDANNYGGGGGGAGGVGAAASASGGGVGGAGIACDITGESVMYAAGGGGGCCNPNTTTPADGIAGGSGDEHGRGGVGQNIAATAGADGTGGGGGARTNAVGAKGGDGVVIIRISMSMNGSLEKPPKELIFMYDGNPHTSYATTVFYTVTGENTGTDIGTYVAVVTPVPGIEWTDGTTDSVTVVMTIKAEDSIDGEVDVTGATVGFFGAAETNWVYDAGTGGYDLLLKFTGAGGFKIPGTTKARILVVGGGGGGGGAYRLAAANQPYGGGGGGGAGGLVVTNALFGAGSYSVSVGAGGAGGAMGTSHSASSNYSGTDGGDTSILLDGVSFITAYGGGAGGGETDGHPGGSGGGGSMYRVGSSSGTTHMGGDGVEGQGRAGGAGDANNYGGGGGGAGGAGNPASASGGGVGGIGLACDITGESVMYASGGGGGCCNQNTTTPEDGIAGGSGDEYGRGGVGQSIAATAGADGAGGGGGGGGARANAVGARGGDGVVYVRISMAMSGSLDKPPEGLTFTYDGNAHTSMVSTVFFDVEGMNIGTAAGVYVATAKLKPGCTWLDGSTGDATVTMKIVPVEVTLNSLMQTGWTYHDSDPPDPVCDYTPSSVKLVYEYAASEDADEWSPAKPVHAGTYWVRVRTADEVNYHATPKTLATSFEIARVPVTFTDLRIRDWLCGTPAADIPSPKCAVSPDWVEAVYEYADAADAAEWSLEKPYAAGTHWLRVRAPDEKNYDYAAAETSFRIVKGLGNIFTDYVEIKVDGWTGSSPYTVLSNFPYKVTLAERAADGSTAYPDEALVGFLYGRAGISGDDIAFTDDDGNVLCFYMKEWDTQGDSTVYVKIPAISNATQTIRFYWRVREGQAAPEHSPGEIWSNWTKEERDAVTQPGHSFSLVYKDGVLVNYFTQLSVMDKTTWAQGEPSGVVTMGSLAEGDIAVKVIDASGTVLSTDPANRPITPGAYRITFTPDDPDGEYEPISYSIDFNITGTLPSDDLSGGLTGEYALTLNGRVMLANDDVAGGHEVKGQAYWRTREVDIGGGKILTNDLYWTHSGEHETTVYANLLDGTSHKLSYIGDGGLTNVLWRLDDVMIGNGYRVSGTLRANQCALPWSSTSLGNSSYSNKDKQGELLEAGNIIMRNREGAVIYSPCYTNGIGTIYFDAVNWLMATSDEEAEKYAIVVEIATETYDGKEPTDENAAGWDGSDFGNISTWTPCEMLPIKRDNGSGVFEAQAKTNTLALAITQGNTGDNFYRVCVPVNHPGVVRFRIRRIGCDKSYTADESHLILLDNIIVSYPGCSASMSPYGIYDSTKGGKQVLGQEAAMANVPFPSVSDAENLLARGKVETFVGPMAGDVSASTFVQSAKLHYRWRYLGQKFDPIDGSWRSVALSPFDGYTALEKLEIPSEPGDVEFWYELATMMPFYSYYDYSGTGAALGGLYTEEVTAVTNRMDASAYMRLPSGGSDWFVRLRDGASEWEDVSVVLTGAYAACQNMELVADHIWRGLVKVPPTNPTGPVSFFFMASNRQSAGGETFVENETTWFPTEDVTTLPSRGEVSMAGSPKMYAADGASGYIEFTFNDASMTFSIGHAEYQNFNGWHDANLGVEKFVGTYAEQSGVATATMLQTNANMKAWKPLWTEDSNWNEAFYLANYLDPGYPKGVTFGMHKMPDQWNGDNGMFVDASLTPSNLTQRMRNSGIAWQMRGEGLGDVTYTQSDGPSGLDQISFKARLAQTINFNDFSVWTGDGATTTNNYTIVVPALMSYNSTLSTYDYAPGASMSVVAYYQPNVGCYELRIERNSTDGLQLSIFKWSQKNYKIVSELLATRWFSGATFWNNSGPSKPNMYGMLLSVGEDASGVTTVIGGLTTASAAPNSSYSGVAYNLVCSQDASSTRLSRGSYGVLTANCNGMFLHPRQYSSPLPNSLMPAGRDFVANKAVSFAGTYSYLPCRARLIDAWAYTPGRTECYTNTSYGFTPFAIGIRAPGDLNQTVDMYMKPRGAGSWPSEPFTRTQVSSYVFSQYAVTVRTNLNCDVMIKVGEAPVDVTVWDIKQTGWNGEDIANIGNLQNDFVYTQARVMDEGSGTDMRRVTMLQPARAAASNALSIRSPLLNGLGMIGFSYKDVKPGCEVWVQAATNSVAGNLSGTFGYNFSTNSVELGQGEPVGSWITLRRYTYDELAAASAQTYYCGWHTHDNAPLVGVFRVVVAPSVVAAAQRHAAAEPEWGSITIADVMVHDEPALDRSSWLGWNIRTLGDDGDTEKRMFLPDLGSGLSAGLNNSTAADIVGDISEYDKVNPCIQSPTFGSYTNAYGGLEQATIGRVRFRARLYETNTASTAVGKISLYGAMDGTVEDWGTALTNFTVDSFAYRTYEYNASSLKRFAAVRLVVDGVTDNAPGVQRVLLDEVSVSERTMPSVGFEYARPFRTGLNVDKEITNILDRDQQPLIDEPWGVQAKIKFDRFDTEIDTSRGFRVFFRYFKGASPWGYDQWENSPGATAWAELVQVGKPEDCVFRSTTANKSSIVPSQSEANSVVQYMVKVEYYLKGSDDAQEALIELGDAEGDGWTNPQWYEPVDYNKDVRYGNGSHFSPYTILDAVSPGRVWINEVNYNDGVKQQTGGVLSETNQFIEIAVPCGVDLSGWKLVLTDMNHANATLAIFGCNGISSSKNTTDGRRSGDYEFLVLQSPGTRDAGGIKDSETGLPAADGTWTSATLPSTFRAGRLEYDEPYQLELFRPSGVLEHQFVIDGTNNLWASWPEYAPPYDGTNLVNELNELDDAAGISRAKRFYAGSERARKADGVTWSSLGVTGGAHGEHGGWTSEMKFTPGRLNEGQDELSGWYLKPHGASIWVYAQSLSPHVRQSIGDDTAQDTFVIVNSGASANISYAIDPWYSIGTLTVNGVPVVSASGATGFYQLNLNNITQTTCVVVSEGVDPQLVEAGLDMSDRYAPAVMRWLSARYAAGTLANPGGPIVLAKQKGLSPYDTAHDLPLKAMYWLDIDPTESGWWFRHGFSGIAGEPVYRKRRWNSSYTEHFTNRQVRVKMYLSNDVTQVVYAPYRLQGLGNEQSDVFTGNWTSETFKVKVMLNNGLPGNVGFLPFRWFTFAPGSFGAKGQTNEFEAQIEMLDPFARSSTSYSYGWYGNWCNSVLYQFSLDDSLESPGLTETLKADSTYNGTAYEAE